MKIHECVCCNSNDWKSIENTIGGHYIYCKKCKYYQHKSSQEVNERSKFESEQKKFYGEDSVMFSPTFQSIQKEISKRRISTIHRHMADGNILEVGPGSGQQMIMAINHGYNVEAVEHSPTLARNISKKTDNKIWIGSFEDIDFGDKKYDAYMSFHVIEHVPNLNSHLEKVNSVLHKGSYIFIATPNANSWEHKVSKTHSPNYCTSHLHLLTPSSISHLLERQGWKIHSIRTPSYSSSWPRVITSLIRKIKNNSEDSTAGEYIKSESSVILYFVKVFRIVSWPTRKIQELMKGGNELLVVAQKINSC